MMAYQFEFSGPKQSQQPQSQPQPPQLQLQSQQVVISPTTSPFGNPPSQVLVSPADPSKTTLWMGELEPWIDENYVRQIWYNLGEQVNVKMIKDKVNGSNAGYCFVDFGSHAAASKALNMVNGTPMPNTNRPFKLNWASGGGINDRREDRGPEFSIFVGDLGPEVNELMLISLFQGRYPSCKSAKIMTDPMTGLSRGYGFVRFSDELDQQRALAEMQGVFCGNRPMRISTATPKNKTGAIAMSQFMANSGLLGTVSPPPTSGLNQFNDPNNTTVFVGGLSGYVTEEELRGFFQGFGEITYVKIPPGKGCGFVQFVHRHSAEMAISQMQGYPIGNSRVRLSWGRSQNDRSGPVPAGIGGMPRSPIGGIPLMSPPSPHAINQFGLPHHLNGIPAAAMDQAPSPQHLSPLYSMARESIPDHAVDDSRQWRSGVYAQ